MNVGCFNQINGMTEGRLCPIKSKAERFLSKGKRKLVYTLKLKYWGQIAENLLLGGTS